MKESFYKFTDPWISLIDYKDNKHFTPDNFNEDMNVQFNNEVQIKDENEALVTLTIELGGTENYPFYLKLSMSAVFYWEEGRSESDINSFLKFNAVSLLISYIRPIIATITSSSRFPTFNLPFIDITQDHQ